MNDIAEAITVLGLFLIMLLAMVLFIGEPDLHDAIIELVRSYIKEC